MNKTYATPDGFTLLKVCDDADGSDNSWITGDPLDASTWDIVHPVGVCFYCEATCGDDRPSCDTCESDIAADIAQSTVSNFIGEGTS